jgi:hypothetical protein
LVGFVAVFAVAGLVGFVDGAAERAGLVGFVAALFAGAVDRAGLVGFVAARFADAAGRAGLVGFVAARFAGAVALRALFAARAGARPVLPFFGAAAARPFFAELGALDPRRDRAALLLFLLAMSPSYALRREWKAWPYVTTP